MLGRQPAGANAEAGNLQAPPIAALFLVKFDKKEGYKITWKRSTRDIQLDGVVEYKSLPSGLHNLDDDIIYFIHEQYAGISAFVKGAASEEERNANFVAVGILASLGQGRMGRSWLHAPGLQELALKVASEATNINILEAYWHQFASKDEADCDKSADPVQSPQITTSQSSKQHFGDMSESSTSDYEQPESTEPDHDLPPSHPAIAIHEALEVLGPLIFPLHRAAILRKRVLFLCSPPLKQACNLVYNLSILSNISSSTLTFIPHTSKFDLSHIRPLFAIGVHDIPSLQDQARANGELTSSTDDLLSPHLGWIACTTDGILEVKKELYDIIVDFSPRQQSNKERGPWPLMKTSHGKIIKATQRDLKRYYLLDIEIKGLSSTLQSNNFINEDDLDDPNAPLLKQSTDEASGSIQSPVLPIDKIVEPLTWSALAYNSFVWWASAGERDANMTEEDDDDIEMLKDLFSAAPAMQDSMATADDRIAETKAVQPYVAIIEYFNRLGTSMVNAVAEILAHSVEDAGSDEREGESGEENVLCLERYDLEQLGLDVWSQNDREFVTELARLYFDRRVEVRGFRLEFCGARLC